jgi:hypothetical protein
VIEAEAADLVAQEGVIPPRNAEKDLPADESMGVPGTFRLLRLYAGLALWVAPLGTHRSAPIEHLLGRGRSRDILLQEEEINGHRQSLPEWK